MDPQEIDNIEFKTTRLKGGYDPDEVDNFLDRVSAEMRLLDSRLHDANSSVQKHLRVNAVLQRQLDSYGDLPTQQIPMQAAGILEAAQRVADDVKRTAEGDASVVLSAAAEDARKILEESQKEADTVNREVARLRTKHEQLRSFLASHLKTGLEELEANRDG